MVARTLLIKGLEFAHAIVIDADGLDARNLYVALTRGSSSLTVVSASDTLTAPKPAAANRSPNQLTLPGL
jgi:hypothetical protein